MKCYFNNRLLYSLILQSNKQTVPSSSQTDKRPIQQAYLKIDSYRKILFTSVCLIHLMIVVHETVMYLRSLSFISTTA